MLQTAMFGGLQQISPWDPYPLGSYACSCMRRPISSVQSNAYSCLIARISTGCRGCSGSWSLWHQIVVLVFPPFCVTCHYETRGFAPSSILWFLGSHADTCRQGRHRHNALHCLVTRPSLSLHWEQQQQQHQQQQQLEPMIEFRTFCIKHCLPGQQCDDRSLHL